MNFELKKTYNFNILTEVAGLIGEKYKLMKVKGILTSDEAVKYTDIATQFETLKPQLPNIPNSVTDLSFVLFEDPNGEEIVLALEYIDTGTISLVQAINIRVNILGVSTEDISLVQTKLKELGYTNFDVKTFE